KAATFFTVARAVLTPGVALFVTRVDDTVTAEGTELALRRAATVSGVAVVRTIVTLFTGGRDSVAAGRLALRLVGREALQRELVVRLARVAVGVEHGDLVDLALFEAERRRHPAAHLGRIAGDGIDRGNGPRGRAGGTGGCRGQNHFAGEALVRRTEIEGDATVDEDEHVVVTVERKPLAADEAEQVTHLAGEVEVPLDAGDRAH